MKKFYFQITNLTPFVIGDLPLCSGERRNGIFVIIEASSKEEAKESLENKKLELRPIFQITQNPIGERE